MRTVLKDMNIYIDGAFSKASVVIAGGRIKEIAPDYTPVSGDSVFEFENAYVFPGFTDVHVHLREPGFSYKETIKTGTEAAARGGFTHICSMPNLNPVPDSVEHLKCQLDIIERDATVHVMPFGAITVGGKGKTLSDMENMAPYTAGFSDDGKGVQSLELMEEAMEKSRALGKIISAHCEDEALLRGGYIHDGEYAAKNGHKGISSESEWKPIKRDIALAAKTGCAYHVCHISCKESVELIREAKKNGVDITCETAPHYLLLDDSELRDEGKFKMNPPIRSREDRMALVEGIADGTIDMIATDHAPHSKEEKSGGVKDSLNGITGLEAAFPMLYTGLVKTEKISIRKLMELMNINPKKRFGFGAELAVGAPADIAVFDLDNEFTISPDNFLSMGKCTPFDGCKAYGRCILTICGGKTVWRDDKAWEMKK